MELSDWTLHYVKARDAIRQTLKEHSLDGDLLTCVHKDKIQHFLITEQLRVPSAKDWYVVVCLNTEENLAFLLGHWDAFLQENLSVLFVNPTENRFWQINPRMHDKVCERALLSQGVRTVANEIPLV